MTIVRKGIKIQAFVNTFLVAAYDGAGLLDSEGHKNLNVGFKGYFAL